MSPTRGSIDRGPRPLPPPLGVFGHIVSFRNGFGRTAVLDAILFRPQTAFDKTTRVADNGETCRVFKRRACRIRPEWLPENGRYDDTRICRALVRTTRQLKRFGEKPNKVSRVHSFTSPQFTSPPHPPIAFRLFRVPLRRVKSPQSNFAARLQSGYVSSFLIYLFLSQF